MTCVITLSKYFRYRMGDVAKQHKKKINKNNMELSQIKLDFSADKVPWQRDLDQVLCIYIYVCVYVYVYIYISSWGNLELQAVDSTCLSHKVVTLEDALNTILDKYQLLLLCYNERSNRGRNTVQWTFQTSCPSFLTNTQNEECNNCPWARS